MSQTQKNKQLTELLARYEAMYSNIIDVINTHSPDTAAKPVTDTEKLILIKDVLLQEISPF